MCTGGRAGGEGRSCFLKCLRRCSPRERECKSHRLHMASQQEANVCEETGELGLLWKWRRAEQIRTVLNANFGVTERVDKEGFQMARTRSEGHSIVLATRDSQLRFLPSPCLYPTFSLQSVRKPDPAGYIPRSCVDYTFQRWGFGVFQIQYIPVCPQGLSSK